MWQCLGNACTRDKYCKDERPAKDAVRSPNEKKGEKFNTILAEIAQVHFATLSHHLEA
jgi:hypothetical protein